MHINRRHKKIKCAKCKKRFVKQGDCDNHVKDVHKIVCSISGCIVFKYNEMELHEHLRYNHNSKMVFRCNKCIKFFSITSELHQHHEVDHDRVKLVELQGRRFPCPRCSRVFLSESMLINHSRDHQENVYGCNECPWHFNTVAGLIKHCQDTYNDRHFTCTTCREVFTSNPDLCEHTQSHHVKTCHLCRRIFVSDDKLFDHMKETHLGSAGCTQEELIEGEQAQARAVQKWFSEMQRRDKKKNSIPQYLLTPCTSLPSLALPPLCLLRGWAWSHLTPLCLG